MSTFALHPLVEYLLAEFLRELTPFRLDSANFVMRNSILINFFFHCFFSYFTAFHGEFRFEVIMMKSE